MGLDESLASMGYIAAARLGHLVVALLRVGDQSFLPFHVITPA